MTKKSRDRRVARRNCKSRMIVSWDLVTPDSYSKFIAKYPNLPVYNPTEAMFNQGSKTIR